MKMIVITRSLLRMVEGQRRGGEGRIQLKTILTVFILKKAFHFFSVKWASLWILHLSFLKSTSTHPLLNQAENEEAFWVSYQRKQNSFQKSVSPLQNVVSVHSAACPKTYEFVQIKGATPQPNSDLICCSDTGLWSQLFLIEFLIFRRLCISWSQASQDMEVPKYWENGSPCGETGLAEGMETLAKSWVSQILKRFIARSTNQEDSDSFWITAKILEAPQNEPNLQVCQLSRNTHSCSLRYSMGDRRRMKASQLAKICTTYIFFFLPLPCSYLPIHIHFYSSLLVLKYYGYSVNLTSPLHLPHYEVYIRLVCMKENYF